MIWHGIFGIESNVEALLSPTHLVLAVGMTLIISGPFRAGWRRLTDQNAPAPGGWLLPPLLALTFVWSVWSFLTQFAHPLVDPGRRPAIVRPVLVAWHCCGCRSGCELLAANGCHDGCGALRCATMDSAARQSVPGVRAQCRLMSFMHDQYRLIPGRPPAWGGPPDPLVEALHRTIWIIAIVRPGCPASVLCPLLCGPYRDPRP
jgi:hypothetical protein